MGRHVAPLTARGPNRRILAAVTSLALFATALGYGILGGGLNGMSGQGSAAGVEPRQPPTTSTDPDNRGESDESGPAGESGAGESGADDLTGFGFVAHPFAERSSADDQDDQDANEKGDRTDRAASGNGQQPSATPTPTSTGASDPPAGDAEVDSNSDSPSSPTKPSDTPTTPSPTPSESPNPTEESPNPTEESPSPTEESPSPTEESPSPTESSEEPDEEPEPTSPPDAPEENAAVELATQEQEDGKVATLVRIVNNTDEPLIWTVGLTYDTVEVDQSWQAEVSASDGELTANGTGENAEIEPGGHAQFGYVADGEPAQPRACTLNGADCRVQ